ncbi:MAG: hypothetical protein AAFX44_09930 [Pseudomonadota bacterium]
MRRLLVSALLVLAGCSPDSDPAVNRTLNISAERLAEIQAKPYVKRYKNGGGPAARLAGLDKDPWPEGVLLMDRGPYLEELGFVNRLSLHAIDGVGVHRIFQSRWEHKSIRRPAGFHRDHYKDLIVYLFDVEPGDSRVITVYRDVPMNSRTVVDYEPVVEHWRLVFTAP